MKKFIYSSHRENYAIVTEFGFFDKLPPQMQSELTKHIFWRTEENFSEFFKGCERSFINRIIVSLSQKIFVDEQLIQSANAFCHEVYFVNRGRVAVREPTCYHETILFYGEGSVINVYQVLMDTYLELIFRATGATTELLTIDREMLLEACQRFPESAAVI